MFFLAKGIGSQAIVSSVLSLSFVLLGLKNSPLRSSPDSGVVAGVCGAIVATVVVGITGARPIRIDK